MEKQVMMVHEWEALMRIDQWDRWWEGELKNHVCRAAKLGKRHVPTLSDALVFGAFGILCGAYGVFLFSQMREGIFDHPWGAGLAWGMLGLAGLLLFQAGRSMVLRRKFKPALETYEAGRRGELGALRAEHRPGARMCLKCLKYTE